MTTYKVTLERTTIQSTEVEIEADNEDEAAKIAEQEAINQVNGLENILPNLSWDLEQESVEVTEVNET